MDATLTAAHDHFPATLESVVQFLHTEGFYASEEALLREIEVRGPERHSSPSPHCDRAPSTVASSEDGDRLQLAALHPQQASAKRKTNTARRGAAVGKNKARSAPEAPAAIRLADPVRCAADRSMPGPMSEPQHFKLVQLRRRNLGTHGSVAAHISHHSQTSHASHADLHCILQG